MLSKEDKLIEALRQIAAMPEDTLWSDSRDDAADLMVDIAQQAIEEYEDS